MFVFEKNEFAFKPTILPEMEEIDQQKIYNWNTTSRITRSFDPVYIFIYISRNTTQI